MFREDLTAGIYTLGMFGGMMILLGVITNVGWLYVIALASFVLAGVVGIVRMRS